LFDSISNKFHHPIPVTTIAPQHLTIKPQPIHTTKPQQIQQQEPITDATGIERAMQNGHTHVIGNTIYIGGSNSQKDWYDDVTKIPTIWKAIPAIQHYKALMFGMTSLPYVKDYAKEIDSRLPFSHMGDLTKSEKYIEAEKVLKANPNITHAVGYSRGGSVALELQKRYPQLQTRTYSAPVVDFSNAISPKYETNQERYRNIGDMVSMFDTGAHLNLKLDFMDQPTLTHQYQNIANKFKPE
jgi:hypothetical protein